MIHSELFISHEVNCINCMFFKTKQGVKLSQAVFYDCVLDQLGKRYKHKTRHYVPVHWSHAKTCPVF